MAKNNNINQAEIIKKVLARISKYWFYVLISIFTALLTVIATLYVPILIGRAIDCMIEAGKVDLASISNILIQVGIVIAVSALSQWLMNVCNNKITFQVTRDIRDEAIKKLG